MHHLRILSIALLLFIARGYPQQSPCPIPQSPRNVNTDKEKGVEYNFVSTKPLITEPVAAETIKFRGKTLYRCDQHYHVPVENTQGIPQEQNGLPQPNGRPPSLGQWVEVHTVYAADRNTDGKCRDALDHDLACCTQRPFVVRGFSARVTDGRIKTQWNCNRTPKKPITPPSGTLFAEWAGSNTGPDKPDEAGCKPIPATWSFVMGEFKIAKSQLEIFCKAHGARQVQSGDRLSKDLTLVGPDASELDKKTCRWVDAGLIRNDAEAKRTCPGKCSARAPLSRWNGLWQTTKPNELSQCSCCPPLRP